MGYFQDGNLSYDAKNYKSAISSYKKSIKAKEEEEAYSLYNLALCYIKLEQYNKAIKTLKLAISKKPKSNFYFNLAYSYLKINDTKKALLYFNTAWAMDPQDEDCERAINHILRNLR